MLLHGAPRDLPLRCGAMVASGYKGECAASPRRHAERPGAGLEDSSEFEGDELNSYKSTSFQRLIFLFFAGHSTFHHARFSKHRSLSLISITMFSVAVLPTWMFTPILYL